MDYELALISVAVAGGYWGVWFVRRRPHGTATFGIMCLAAAGLSCLGLLGHRIDAEWLGVAGAIGVGGGSCLLVVGPLVRAAARWFATRERYSVASRLLDIADILAPGSGVAEEKAMLGAMREIRDGRIDQTVDALTAARDSAPAEARLAIDERIAMLYLAAYRWTDAIAYAEAHLFAEGEAQSGGPLRRALGVAPPVWVELLGAYGRTGDLDRAAKMMAKLEDVCAGRDDAGLWVHRARLMFLALAGRPDSVRVLVKPRLAKHMSLAARTYWVGVAHERHGNSALAEAAYNRARDKSRGKPRDLIDRALDELATAKPAQLSDEASEIVARVETSPLPTITVRDAPRGPWVTNAITVVLLAVAGVVSLVLGPSSDAGVLLRAGADAPTFVSNGEWWRVVSAVFLHIGGLHLLVNTLGMWFLGRIAEEVFGGTRMLAIFGVAGVAGAFASYLASPGMSAGASGAIFGLLGAVFVEITWHRAKYRQVWKRGMWGGLAVVTLAQVAYGFMYPIIDQWAHGAGLAAGALTAVLLSPNARWATAGKYFSRALASAFVLASLAAAVFVARTSVEDSLDHLPRSRVMLGTVSVEAPTAWGLSGESVQQRDLWIALHLRREDGALKANLENSVKGESKNAPNYGFDEVDKAKDQLLPLPPGWEGEELAVSAPDPLGSRQRYRAIVVGKVVRTGREGQVIIATLYVPETVVQTAPAYFTSLLGSVQ
jgi:membrane associated rhomboid family serine protease